MLAFHTLCPGTRGLVVARETHALDHVSEVGRLGGPTVRGDSPSQLMRMGQGHQSLPAQPARNSVSPSQKVPSRITTTAAWTLVHPISFDFMDSTSSGFQTFLTNPLKEM